MRYNITSDLKKILWKLNNSFKQYYKNRLIKILLYGSRARGDEEVDSDIDILVVLEKPVNPVDEILNTGTIVADLSLEYNLVISCIFMDREEFERRNSMFLNNIRKESIII